MSSEIEALWSEFAAETEEHLDAIERLLSDRRIGTFERDEIGALFRYFHSLKGTFLAMGFANVEAVAHRCEDILSLVREGRAPLDAELAQVLLRAVDRLKGLREEVLAARKDVRPAGDLLAALERHAGPREAAAPEAAPAVSGDVPLAEDPEMLGIYSELLDQRLPLLALAFSADPEDRVNAAETAGELAYGAEMMGFEALAERLQAVAALAADMNLDQTALIDHFSGLREQAQIIEEVTGITSGAAAFAAGLAGPLADDYRESLDRIEAALAPLYVETVQDPAPIETAMAAAARLRAIASCLGFEHSARLMLFLEERLRAAESWALPERAGFAALAHDTIERLRPAVDATADLGAEDAADLITAWEASFRPPVSPGLAGAEQQLRKEMLATLSDEQRRRLEKALTEGLRAYEVLFELEANPDIAADIIAWLSSAVETITSRTLYRDGVNCFEFLIFSEHGLEWLNAQLAALDPERACLHGIFECGRSADQDVAPDLAAAPAPMVRAALIRVRSETIDELMAEVGEMRSALARFADIVQHGRIAAALDAARRAGNGFARQDPQQEAMEKDLRELKTLEQTLEAAHRRIWTAGLQLRVIPVDGLFARLSRAARDLAQRLGKDVDVVSEGREVRIDKSIVDGLIDPLMHMVRNAVDHGIETRERRLAQGKPRRARLMISAAERGNHIEIIIADDGQGLDRAKILTKAIGLGMVTADRAEQMPEREINALIFQPGFSTADAITDISGRGVGLDVVAATLQRLGGTIDMETWPGSGTRFSLKLPISAALLRSLLVEVDKQIFALPERQVVGVLEIGKDAVESVAGRPIVLYRGAAVPVTALATLLGFEPSATGDVIHLAIVASGSGMLALSVGRVLRFQDLFLKELHPMLAASPLIAGASVLGDGRPVLVLDPRGFANHIAVGGATPASVQA